MSVRLNTTGTRLHESERDFQRAITDLAQLYGYLVYHPLRSEGSTPGWPDLAMAKAGRPLLLIEIKTLTGRVTLAQQAWLDVLHQTEGRIRAEVWRPDCWGHILSIIEDGMP